MNEPTRREALQGLAAASVLAGTLKAQNTAGSLCLMSTVEMARLIRAKKLSAREALAVHLKQIERVNPKVNAIVTLVPEMAAQAAIKAIHSAQVQYYSQYGRYATSLTELGPPASGAASISAADLIGNDLAGGEKQNYKFSVTGNGGGYVINATPLTYNSSGRRSFYSDQSMVVHANDGPEPATLQSKEIR